MGSEFVFRSIGYIILEAISEKGGHKMYEYELEELLPIVAEVSKQYLGYESTSMTYECANRLMEGILYSIQECFEQEDSIQADTMLPAKDAYVQGQRRIQAKMKNLLELYNREIDSFDDYGLYCLRDTIQKGIPSFLQYYDYKFFPQDTLLTLDYPIRQDYDLEFSKTSGVDRILPYTESVFQEQKQLRRLPREVVIGRLRNYHGEYEELIENIMVMLGS